LTKLGFSRRATRHLDAIYDRIARDNPTAARAVMDRIHEVAGSIQAFPEIGGKPCFGMFKCFP
jgi:plasmid stabilization system protein ParE